MELRFKLEKTTRNTCRYQEELSNEHPPVIGTLYIQKWFLGNPPPEEIKLKIEKWKEKIWDLTGVWWIKQEKAMKTKLGA